MCPFITDYCDTAHCGLRPSVLGQDRGVGPKNRSFLLLQVCCVVTCETRSCHARRHNDIEGHSNFLSTICAVVRRSQNFRPAALQTPFPEAQDGQILISWRWSLPSPTDPVW